MYYFKDMNASLEKQEVKAKPLHVCVCTPVCGFAFNVLHFNYKAYLQLSSKVLKLKMKLNRS